MKKPLLIVPIVALIAFAGWSLFRAAKPETASLSASGTVEATEARLGFQSPGRIASILVNEGDRVEAGAILGTLDDSELQARWEQAAAMLSTAQAQLQELERGSRREEIAQAESAIAVASERVEDSRRDMARTQKLFEGGAATREALDKTSTSLSIVESQLDQAKEQLSLVQRGARSERVDAQRGQVEQAEAALRAIDAVLANMTIVAPIDGIVTVRHREPNEIASPGQPVITLMEPSDRWVRIYIPENRIGAVSLGDRATIRSDTWPDRTYQGRVVHIASEAEFTPKNVQTTEERVRLVYAIKVAIEEDSGIELKPGMPADVVLDPRDTPPASKG